MLVAFCSEEQGLRGSRALAKEMKDQGKDVVLMIQIDVCFVVLTETELMNELDDRVSCTR